MTATSKSSHVATVGAILGAVACALAVLYAMTSADVFLMMTIGTGILALVLCGLGIVICLATGRRGAVRATLGGGCIILPALLASST
jgi:hypothetical protein